MSESRDARILVSPSPPLWKRWWMAARPRTLTASVVPVAVALALAPPRDIIEAGVAALTLVAALSLQVAVNLANDFYDAAGGIDTNERLGPTRVVQAGLLPAAAVKRGFGLALVVAAAAGVPLVLRGGVPIVAIGLASMISAWAYAGGSKPLASRGLGDAFVFVFFGVVPVVGTVWLQRLVFDPVALLVSLPIALLATAILVVNNLRDVATDEAAGKKTLAVRIGAPATRLEYAACVVVALALALPLAAFAGAGVLLVLASAPLARSAIRRVYDRSGAELNASLAETARLQAVYGALLALGLLL